MVHREEIPFSVYRHSKSSRDAVGRVLAGGRTAGGGPHGEAVETALTEIQDGATTLLTSSCTHAIEMAALLFDVREGDEIIMPSFSFVTLATAFAMRGARIVFADSSLDSGACSLSDIERVRSSRTKVICVVNYGGGGFDAAKIREWADRHGLWFLEDNAHGIGGTLEGERLGSFGHVSVTSFHQTKNISCGEGGAITLNQPELIERAQILREKGTDRRKFAEGRIDKYVWQDLGSSWVLSEIQSAVLHSELLTLNTLLDKRRSAWSRYDSALASIAHDVGWRTPQLGRLEEHTAHIYWFVLSSQEERVAFIEHCRRRGVAAVPHYQALHESPGARKVNASSGGQLKNAEILSNRLVRIPLFKMISDAEINHVIFAVDSFARQRGH